MESTISKTYITLGSKVFYQEGKFKIKRILNSKSLLLESLQQDGKMIRAEINEVTQSIDEVSILNQISELKTVIKEDWEIAQERFSFIRPIVTEEIKGSEIKIYAREKGVNLNTLNSWIQRYKKNNQIYSLSPSHLSKNHFPEELQNLLKEAALTISVNHENKNLKEIIEDFQICCRNRGLEIPNSNIIREKLKSLYNKQKLEERYGLKAANETYYENPKNIFPLSNVQIDHAEIDVIIVDEQHTHSIGKPWITLAIDVFSRMIIGFYISFDIPGVLATKMCVANAILYKEAYMAKADFNGDWPCWGVMETIHTDTTNELRSTMFKKTFEEYGINLKLRPVSHPSFGCHIERLLGTFLTEINNLDGLNFSNSIEKKKDNLTQIKTLTLKEFEQWILSLIINEYHNRLHIDLGTTPLLKFNEGIYGSTTQLGNGLPERIYNERKVKLDFLPPEEYKIEEYGVMIDHIQYNHKVLKKWINSIDRGPGKSKIRKEFIFKRDPKDISIVFFYDPDLKEYLEIPYKNSSNPAITIWELRKIKSILLKENCQSIDENMIFEYYKRLPLNDIFQSHKITPQIKMQIFEGNKITPFDDLDLTFN